MIMRVWLSFQIPLPRGDIAWNGQEEQPFVYGKLDNGVPVFAVNAGYNLSFIKNRLIDLRKIIVPNTGTQFRSRDQYPAAAIQILQGNKKLLGEKINIRNIPGVPECAVGSIDGYGNIKTTLRKSKFLADVDITRSPLLRVKIDKRSHFALNTLIANVKGATGDLCVVVGSSGGKNDAFIEVIRLQGRAAYDFKLDDPRDDLEPIVFEPPIPDTLSTNIKR
jgi:S-adenosylmethionine hydrolase